MEQRQVPDWRRRLRHAWGHRPFTFALSLVLPIPGGLALVLGDDVSQALSNIAADYVSRGMGAALLAGSVLTLLGIARGAVLVEYAGMVVTAFGTAIYGLGVILGLGLAGTVAGSISLAITAGLVLRIVSLSMVTAEIRSGNGG